MKVLELIVLTIFYEVKKKINKLKRIGVVDHTGRPH